MFRVIPLSDSHRNAVVNKGAHVLLIPILLFSVTPPATLSLQRLLRNVELDSTQFVRRLL